jgi:hypothetical protein
LKGAWVLLAELAPSCPEQVECKIIIQKWQNIHNNINFDNGMLLQAHGVEIESFVSDDEIQHAARVLKVLESVVHNLPQNLVAQLAGTHSWKLEVDIF